MVGLGVNHRVYRMRPRRRTVRDLHGPFASDTSCWPAPYRHPIESAAQNEALNAQLHHVPNAIWSHGKLVAVTSQEELHRLAQRWGRERTEGAAIGPLEHRPMSDADRDLMRKFCGRGWQRLLVRAFEHVGCKAEHLGVCDEESLTSLGPCGKAILHAKERHRLAVLEELVQRRGGDVQALFGDLDRLDQALDDLGGNRSWTMENVPAHVRSIWPMRNLFRAADRMRICFQPMRWQTYEDANTYAPELHILALEPDIYGGGVEHDITHYLETVFWSPERVPFEVGNNGSEGDGQAMNNLILAKIRLFIA